MLKPSLITNKTKKDQLCIVHCECIYCGFKQCLLEEFGPFSRVFHAFLALFMPCLQIVFLSFFCHTSFLTTQDFPLFFSHRFFLSACIYCYWCSPQDHFFLSSGTQNRSDVARRHRCAVLPFPCVEPSTFLVHLLFTRLLGCGWSMGFCGMLLSRQVSSFSLCLIGYFGY